MRYLLLSTLLICQFIVQPCQAQSRPKGFLGVNWGAGAEAVVGVLRQRAGVQLPDAVNPGTGSVEAVGGTFAGQEVGTWTLEFVENRFVAATVRLKATDENASAMYKELKQQLSAKYGAATGEKKLDTPENRRNRNQGDRKRTGSAAFWRFRETLQDKNEMLIELTDPGDSSNSPDIAVRYALEAPNGGAAAANASAVRPVRSEDL